MTKVWYQNGSTHPCVMCGSPIINLFVDPDCTVPITGDELCWPCGEFGGPVDDLGLWEEAEVNENDS